MLNWPTVKQYRSNLVVNWCFCQFHIFSHGDIVRLHKKATGFWPSVQFQWSSCRAALRYRTWCQSCFKLCCANSNWHRPTMYARNVGTRGKSRVCLLIHKKHSSNMSTTSATALMILKDWMKFFHLMASHILISLWEWIICNCFLVWTNFYYCRILAGPEKSSNLSFDSLGSEKSWIRT